MPVMCCSVSPFQLVLNTTLMTGACVVFILVVGRACGEVSKPVVPEQMETAAVATAVSGLDSFYGNPPTGWQCVRLWKKLGLPRLGVMMRLVTLFLPHKPR